MQELGTLNQVADDARIVGNLDAVSFFSGDRRGMRVGNRAHTADALDDLSRILGSAILHDKLHAAEAAA